MTEDLVQLSQDSVPTGEPFALATVGGVGPPLRRNRGTRPCHRRRQSPRLVERCLRGVGRDPRGPQGAEKGSPSSCCWVAGGVGSPARRHQPRAHAVPERGAIELFVAAGLPKPHLVMIGRPPWSARSPPLRRRWAGDRRRGRSWGPDAHPDAGLVSPPSTRSRRRP